MSRSVLLRCALPLGADTFGRDLLSRIVFGAQLSLRVAVLSVAAAVVAGSVLGLLAPDLAIFPGLASMLAVLGFNLLGDGLRDVLDPRLRR